MFGNLGDSINDAAVLQAMSAITREQVTSFDQKTHRRIKVGMSRFSYLYYAAHLVDHLTAEEITGKVLDHLVEAYQLNIKVWGVDVWRQISHQVKFSEIPVVVQKALKGKVDPSSLDELKDLPLNQYPRVDQEAMIYELGRVELTEAYRKLILRVISELWIDYLTKMEALRISIGLEAYAQRDPLVAYKTKASEMFQNLFNDMQSSVVHKMFTFRPQPTATASGIQASSKQVAKPTDSTQKQQQKSNGKGTAKKKKRRRRR